MRKTEIIPKIRNETLAKTNQTLPCSGGNALFCDSKEQAPKCEFQLCIYYGLLMQAYDNRLK